MADSANTGGEVDERDRMVVDWSDLTEEDRLVVAELVAQEQQQQPREEPEAAAEPPDNDESRAAAAVLDALFNDTSSESDFEGFAPAEVEALMMPMVQARVDSSEDEMGENNEGEGLPATDESDSDIDQAPADGLDADDISNTYMLLKGIPVFNERHGPLIHTQNPPPSRFSPIFSLMRSWICSLARQTCILPGRRTSWEGRIIYRLVQEQGSGLISLFHN